jgi:outer membrane receptor protein involved in Fe transport
LAHYSLDVGPGGKLAFNFNGTEVINFNDEPIPGGVKYDCAGYFGATCGAPTPHWRHVFGTTWQTPWQGLDITGRWRYIGPVDVDSSSQNPDLAGSYYIPASHIGGYTYIDLSASIPLSTSGVSVRVGVNNLADKTPPVVVNGSLSACPNATCNDNTWVGTYDTLGRYMYAHVSAKF